jgi:Protein of unknown function (DUF1573)
MKKVNMMFAVLFAVVIWSAGSFEPNKNTVKEKGAQFQWSETNVQIGKIKQNNPQNVSFEFKNVGDQPLIITDLKASCSCSATSTDLIGKPIAPNQTATVTAVFNASSLGVFNKNVTVHSNVGDPVVLTFTGEVVE